MADNLALGAWGRGRANEAEQTQLVYDMFPRLAERRRQRPVRSPVARLGRTQVEVAKWTQTVFA